MAEDKPGTWVLALSKTSMPACGVIDGSFKKCYFACSRSESASGSDETDTDEQKDRASVLQNLQLINDRSVTMTEANQFAEDVSMFANMEKTPH